MVCSIWGNAFCQATFQAQKCPWTQTVPSNTFLFVHNRHKCQKGDQNSLMIFFNNIVSDKYFKINKKILPCHSEVDIVWTWVKTQQTTLTSHKMEPKKTAEWVWKKKCIGLQVCFTVLTCLKDKACAGITTTSTVSGFPCYSINCPVHI